MNPSAMADVNDIADSELLSRAIRGARKVPRTNRAKTVPMWVKVGEMFALGSTYSQQLCRRFGCDPNLQVRP